MKQQCLKLWPSGNLGQWSMQYWNQMGWIQWLLQSAALRVSSLWCREGKHRWRLGDSLNHRSKAASSGSQSNTADISRTEASAERHAQRTLEICRRSPSRIQESIDSTCMCGTYKRAGQEPLWCLTWCVNLTGPQGAQYWVKRYSECVHEGVSGWESHLNL